MTQLFTELNFEQLFLLITQLQELPMREAQSWLSASHQSYCSYSLQEEQVLEVRPPDIEATLSVQYSPGGESHSLFLFFDTHHHLPVLTHYLYERFPYNGWGNSWDIHGWTLQLEPNEGDVILTIKHPPLPS